MMPPVSLSRHCLAVELRWLTEPSRLPKCVVVVTPLLAQRCGAPAWRASGVPPIVQTGQSRWCLFSSLSLSFAFNAGMLNFFGELPGRLR
jgi:hypothetical protein